MRLRKLFLIVGLIIVFCIAGFYFYISPRYVVPILMYHRIDERGGVSSLSVSPENFRRQMRFLSRRNYNVISLTDFEQAKTKNKKFPRNTVVLTCDDGYEDNYTFAFPVLKKYGFPATIFVIVDSIGAEGFLKSAQIREMASSGIITIASHSLSGTYLPGTETGELKRQICASKRILQVRLNKKVEHFCYPIGGFSPEIQEIVKRCGYKTACTTNRGMRQIYLNDDIFALKRVKIKDSDNLFVFWVKVSGYYNFFRRVRKPH